MKSSYKIDYDKLSPLMRQYIAAKEQYPDHILLFRVGDFYEMFYDDAVTVSKALDLTLTGKDCGQTIRAPMCGVPHHAADGYIKKLIDKGFKAAICEQMEDPKTAKGLVDRQVIKVVTPGTLTDSDMLQADSNNYIAGIYADKKELAVCFTDISTGSVKLSSFTESINEKLINSLSRYAPSEIVFNERFLDNTAVSDFIRQRLDPSVQLLDGDKFDPAKGTEILLKQFNAEDISELGFAEGSCELKCACGLFGYIADTQKALIGRFTSIDRSDGKKYMELDYTAVRNLELMKTMRSNEEKGSLVWVLDRTQTSMGKRMLKACIEQPLINPAAIIARHTAVEQLCGDPVALGELASLLSEVYDVERLMTKIMYKSANPRDLKALQQTCEKFPLIKKQLEVFNAPLIKRLGENIFVLDDLTAIISNSINEDPPAQLKDGGVIKDGYDDELDRLRGIMSGGENVIRDIEERERESTGIKNLKISYNRVFGYYIEVTKSYYELVPEHYIRKQTLANCERYITEELKNTENEIAGAKDKILGIEAEIFEKIRNFAGLKMNQVQSSAASVAALDVLCSFACVSSENGYVRPDITADGVIDIKDGRHPVVEKMLKDEVYVPNDTYLDKADRRMSIITGPNMSGKSTYMRQTALIVLMAQTGCFVPASSARIGIVDKIFTRVGASDDLTAGQSTFMVEMSEVAQIIRNATPDSLVILDEVGRGTSTFDGISIATAVAEHIAGGRGLKCKTLFATHYHELTALEGKVGGIKNYSVAVMKKGEEIRFLRKIVEGGTDDSYGIEVARLAGLPNKLISRAKQLLKEMEFSQGKKFALPDVPADEQVSFGRIGSEEVISRIKKTNVDELSGDEALAFLKELAAILEGK